MYSSQDSLRHVEGTTAQTKRYADAVKAIVGYHKGATPTLDQAAKDALNDAWRYQTPLSEWARRSEKAIDRYDEPRFVTIGSVWAIGHVPDPLAEPRALVPDFGTPEAVPCDVCGVRGGRHRYNCQGTA